MTKGVASAQAVATAAAEEALLTKVAALLFVNGQTTEATRVAVERLGASFGLEARLLLRWGELTILSDRAPLGRPSVAEPLSVDIGRVEATERIVDDVCAGRTGVADGSMALEAVGHLPPVSIVRFAGMAAAGAAALGVIFGAADALTLALIAVGAGAGACLRRAASHLSTNPFAQPFVAALLAGAISSAASILDLPATHRLVAVCPCMVLVPGPHFLNGMIDLARARMALGAARVGFAALIVLAISAGLLAGLSLGAANLTGEGPSPTVPLAYDVCAAGVAVAAYGSFFNMPWRTLPLPIGIGMLAHALRWGVLSAGAGIQAGAFCACLLVGVTVSPLAHRLRLPFGAFSFASVVSLVPGIFMFQAAAQGLALIAPGTSVADAVQFRFLRDTGTACSVLLAMTAGLIVPKMFFDHVVTRRVARPSPTHRTRASSVSRRAG